MESVCMKENYERRHGNKETYRILTVDGGGVCGIIPAFWICEIEKRTHKPVSHLFNMFAGTSTGGILLAGLSVPKNDDGFTPMYRSYDLLDFYNSRASEFFELIHLETIHLLTQLWQQVQHRHIFLHIESKVKAFLMMVVYVQITVALTEAMRYSISKDNIFMLSLGTGTYIPDSLSNESSRGLLFWAANLHQLALQAQIGNSDISISNTLGQKYKRWQVWFENDMCLDDYSDEHLNNLLNFANQFIEQIDESEENSFNKTVEYLLN